MEEVIRDYMLRDNVMDREYYHILMVRNMLGVSLMGSMKERENILGLLEKSMLVFG
jgi:hypothetical protein